MAGLYCNTHKVYRDLRGGLANWVSCDTANQATIRRRGNAYDTAMQRLRQGSRGHDTAACALRHGVGHPRHGRLGPATRRLCGHDTARSAPAWARLCAPGCAGWASRLCTSCTQPVFGLSTVSKSLIGRCS